VDKAHLDHIRAGDAQDCAVMALLGKSMLGENIDGQMFVCNRPTVLGEVCGRTVFGTTTNNRSVVSYDQLGSVVPSYECPTLGGLYLEIVED
jgi:hypothetical protein